jgi:hypothetical protein
MKNNKATDIKAEEEEVIAKEVKVEMLKIKEDNVDILVKIKNKIMIILRRKGKVWKKRLKIW